MIHPTPTLKTKPMFTLAATLLGGVAASLQAEEIPLKQCPEPVVKTIKSQLGLGHLDEIKTVRAEGRILYLAEIDLPGARERKLHVGDDGTLLKVVEEVPLGDLPRSVKSTLEPFLAGRNRFDSADRVTSPDRTDYYVEVDLSDDRDLQLIIAEGGEILRRREVGDF